MYSISVKVSLPLDILNVCFQCNLCFCICHHALCLIFPGLWQVYFNFKLLKNLILEVLTWKSDYTHSRLQSILFLISLLCRLNCSFFAAALFRQKIGNQMFQEHQVDFRRWATATVIFMLLSAQCKNRTQMKSMSKLNPSWYNLYQKILEAQLVLYKMIKF